jgi:hypothetical protein
MTSEIERTIRVLSFTEKSFWTVWSKKFLARAHVKGYKKLLFKTEQVPKLMSNSNLNEVAYDDLW